MRVSIDEARTEECTMGIQRLMGCCSRKVAYGGNPTFFNGYITEPDRFACSIGNPCMTDNSVNHFRLPLLAFAQCDSSVAD